MQSSPVFCLKDCTYGLTMDKRSTARATIFNAGVKHVYTLETSFYGYSNTNATFRLSEKEFDGIALTLISSL
jgi:hypothetical protein